MSAKVVHPARRLLRLFVSLVLVATAGVSLAVQQPALAAAPCAGTHLSNGHISFEAKGPCYTVPVAHSCETIGTLSNGNQANVCADIYTAYDTQHWEIWGSGEYYCQGPSDQCKGINANNTVSVGPDYGTSTSATYQCSTTSCPNGTRETLSTGHIGDTKIAGAFCYTATSTIPAGDAILVQGTSTAYHPKAGGFSTSAVLCFLGVNGYK